MTIKTPIYIQTSIPEPIANPAHKANSPDHIDTRYKPHLGPERIADIDHPEDVGQVMDVPEKLLDLICRFEGLRLRAYFCPSGVLTCGYGSTGPDIKPDTVWTQEQAKARMVSDAVRFVSATRKLCPGLTGDNLAALADFAYNLGATRLAGSTLRRKINVGDIDGAKAELRKWVRGGGKVLPGLVIRREAEAMLLQA